MKKADFGVSFLMFFVGIAALAAFKGFFGRKHYFCLYSIYTNTWVLFLDDPFFAFVHVFDARCLMGSYHSCLIGDDYGYLFIF